MSATRNLWERILAFIWPGRTSFTKEQDQALGSKLKDLNWTSEEDKDLDSLEKREQAASAGDDSLAATVFKSRGQNPFSDKF